eukprot:5553941-Prymnesium_polylepis.1
MRRPRGAALAPSGAARRRCARSGCVRCAAVSEAALDASACAPPREGECAPDGAAEGGGARRPT